MKAAILTATRQVEIQDLPIPKAGPGEVLIRVRAAGICGAELHAFMGCHPFRKPPLQMGHEMAGEVADIGPGVTSVKKGEQVSVLPPRPCGHCQSCIAGAPNLCVNRMNLGTTTWPGCFAEYILSPEDSVFKVPSSVTPGEAAIAEPLSIAVHAVRRFGASLGGSIAILGAGTIGLACVAAAREAGATHMYVTDVSDYNLKMAKRFGAFLTVNSSKEDPVAVIREATDGHGVDAAIVAVGFSTVLNQAIAMVRPQGTVVVVALFDEVVKLDQLYSLISGEKIVTSSWASTPQDFKIAIDLIASGRVKAEEFITHRLPLERTEEGLALLEKRHEDCVKIMLDIA